MTQQEKQKAEQLRKEFAAARTTDERKAILKQLQDLDNSGRIVKIEYEDGTTVRQFVPSGPISRGRMNFRVPDAEELTRSRLL